MILYLLSRQICLCQKGRVQNKRVGEWESALSAFRQGADLTGVQDV